MNYLMYTIEIDGKEILQIPKVDKKTSNESIFFALYVSLILIVALITHSPIFLIDIWIPIVIFVSLYFIALLMYVISMDFFKDWRLTITENSISVKKPFRTYERDFQTNHLTKIIIREYIGARTATRWICALYAGRKYIEVYSGISKPTAILIANTLSKEMNLQNEEIPSKKVRKKLLYKISNWILTSFVLVMIPLFIFVAPYNVVIVLIILLSYLVILIPVMILVFYYTPK